MTIPNLKNDAERVNLEAESPAFHKLCSDSWAVQIPRSVATSNRFDAVVVYAAACAWRDRGQGFGHTDDEGVFTRNAAAIPPGGWPALVGVTPPTWRRWRDAAVSAKLIKIESSPERLLRPLVERQDGEQWARVEVAFLFHRELSKRTRRAFVALSLFRQKDDSVSMSIRKIGKDAGLEKRHVRRALRELEAMGALQSVGQTSHGIHRYMVIKAPLPVNFDRTTVNFDRQTVNFDRTTVNFDRQTVKTVNFGPPLKNLLHESLSRIISGIYIRPDSAHPEARPDGKPDFELFKVVYPKRSGAQPWARAVKAANARTKEGATFMAMNEGAERYAAYCEATGKTGTEFVMQAATFLGPEKHFLEPWDSPPSKSEAREQRNREAAKDFLERDGTSDPANPPDEPERAMPMAATVKETTKPTGPPVATPESQSARQKEAERKKEETMETLDAAADDDTLSKTLLKLARSMGGGDGTKVA